LKSGDRRTNACSPRSFRFSSDLCLEPTPSHFKHALRALTSPGWTFSGAYLILHPPTRKSAPGFVPELRAPLPGSFDGHPVVPYDLSFASLPSRATKRLVLNSEACVIRQLNAGCCKNMVRGLVFSCTPPFQPMIPGGTKPFQPSTATDSSASRLIVARQMTATAFRTPRTARAIFQLAIVPTRFGCRRRASEVLLATLME